MWFCHYNCTDHRQSDGFVSYPGGAVLCDSQSGFYPLGFVGQYDHVIPHQGKHRFNITFSSMAPRKYSSHHSTYTYSCNLCIYFFICFATDVCGFTMSICSYSAFFIPQSQYNSPKRDASNELARNAHTHPARNILDLGSNLSISTVLVTHAYWYFVFDRCNNWLLVELFYFSMRSTSGDMTYQSFITSVLTCILCIFRSATKTHDKLVCKYSVPSQFRLTSWPRDFDSPKKSLDIYVAAHFNVI